MTDPTTNAGGTGSAAGGDARNPPQQKPLAGQHAIVTGGGRGIGAAIAGELAALGASLTLTGRNGERLEATAAALRERHGVRCQGLTADLTDPEAVAVAFEKAAETFSPPSILINNAGRGASAPFTRTELDLWREMLDLNLTGVYLGCRQVLPAMLAAGHGRIVNVASTAGLRGYPYISAYCAAKHGVIGLTRALAAETASKGITVNAVCPGYVDTEMTRTTIANIQKKTGRSEEEARADLAALNPQGRLVEPGEVARAVAWLCLPGQESLTGQAIALAGGEIM